MPQNDIKIDFGQFNPKELDRLAKQYAEIFVTKDRLKTHQLRNVFSSIEKMRSMFKQKKNFDEELEMQLIMLKPKIAYAAGRQKSVRYNFFPFVEAAVDSVIEVADKKEEKNTNRALHSFFALMESVVGYHKFFESK
jgi:CRISPR-associated protein Csm2